MKLLAVLPLLAVAFAVAVSSHAGAPPRDEDGRRPLPPMPIPGDTLEPFTATDSDGRPREVKTKGKGTVLMFVSGHCAASVAWAERIASLARRFEPKGFTFFGLAPNHDDTAQQSAAKLKLPFPVLRDEKGERAHRLGAKVTPEAFVYDADGRLRYRGRVDDDRSGAGVTKHELEDALEGLASGKGVAIQETRAGGCPIRRTP
jgi:peroxiredoxin